ncbi:hypothetical protein C5167_014562 [Papaver somniferum]|uniref:DEAD-box RNA helicase Q domain-containing protein n=1 Tax=Papaver somniferum TaxID=3469 RepID=A0A4Y7J3K2_PAPSO|nr:hypothetical protein C5167_014562 [Papaver somniferum]
MIFSGFGDSLLKPELLRAIVDSGFEHPSKCNQCYGWLCNMMNAKGNENSEGAINIRRLYVCTE